MQNRRGKTRESNNTEIEPKPSESSFIGYTIFPRNMYRHLRLASLFSFFFSFNSYFSYLLLYKLILVRQQKRKRSDSDNASKIEHFAELRRQKRERKLKGNANNTDEQRAHYGSSGGTAPLSGKRKIERKNANMRSEAQRHSSAGAKNSSKLRKPSSKRQKR